MAQEYEHIVHPFPPLFDDRSRVLMLGTLPSPKARERGLPYGHPQNRFWPVMAKILGEELPDTNDGKRAMLLRHGVALWDVIASCDIAGASDASIKNPEPSDLSVILDHAPIQAIFCTGTKATQLYRKLVEPLTGRPCIGLPSTSPANAAMRFDDLVERYSVILPYLSENSSEN